jgi:hypothetical protein
MLLISLISVKIGAIRAVLLLRVSIYSYIFRVCCPIWVEIGIQNLHLLLLSILQHSEHGPTKGPYFPFGRK